MNASTAAVGRESMIRSPQMILDHPSDSSGRARALRSPSTYALPASPRRARRHGRAPVAPSRERTSPDLPLRALALSQACRERRKQDQDDQGADGQGDRPAPRSRAGWEEVQRTACVALRRRPMRAGRDRIAPMRAVFARRRRACRRRDRGWRGGTARSAPAWRRRSLRKRRGRRPRRRGHGRADAGAAGPRPRGRRR